MQPPPSTTKPSVAHDLTVVLVSLMKGVTFRETDPALFQSLLALESRARDHVAVLGLELVVDEAEGHAYLRQRPAIEGEPEPPRLVPRRALGYPVSLLLALLRKKLAEFDARGEDTRLVLSTEEIAELLRVFLPETGNEAKLLDRVDAHLHKIVELGFLRRLKGQPDRYEVRRILKAFVDAQWLAALDERLAAYLQHAVASSDESEGA